MTTTYGPGPETLRRPGRAAGGAAAFLLLAAFFAFGTTTAGGVVGGAALVVLSALSVIGAVRMARSGVYVTRDGITVRDALRTRRLPWRDIREISAATADPAFRMLGIVMSDGTRVRCTALATMLFEDATNYRFQLMQERLEQQLARARSDGRCPG
jgi:hypothetical protein